MAHIHVHIEADRGFWERSDGVAVRGHAFRGNDRYRTADLLDLVEATPADEFSQLVAELNGFFAIVARYGDTVHLAVDRIQSYPLFYATDDGRAFVSNDAHWIRDRLSTPRVDALREYELLLAGMVTGSDTLYPDIKPLEAGELVSIAAREDGVAVTPRRYKRLTYRPGTGRSESALLDELDDALEEAFRRLARVADGRQLAISLSGGPDSRLIACMLRKLDYSNLLAFTYGRPGNWDSTVAAEVADALDIPLEVVEYDHDMWFDWFHSEERREYYRYAFNFETLPNIGASPAVARLTRSGRIDDDAIVLVGTLIPTRFDFKEPIREGTVSSSAELASYIVEKYFDGWAWEDETAAAAFRSRIESQLDLADGADPVAVASAFKDWRIRNRIAKIHVSPEEFAYWGLDYWTPLWDEALVEFWEEVPMRFRIGKKLHRTYVDELYRSLTGAETSPPDTPEPGLLGRLERWVGNSRLDRVVRPVYERVEATYKRHTRPSSYHSDPVATLGIMSEAQFESLRRSPQQDVHPFKGLELLGCVRFDPPDNHAGPVDGRLDLEPLRSADHAARRDALPWFAPADVAHREEQLADVG